jgi:GNAT superfamily N-acetyltransferase
LHDRVSVDVIDGRTIDSATADELAALVNAVNDVDSPHLEHVSGDYMRLNLKYSWDNRGIENVFIARADGRIVAYAEMALPVRDNRQMAFAEMCVHPAHRPSSLGEEVLEQIYAVMRANERTLLCSNAWAGSDLERFWLEHGLDKATVSAQRRLVPAQLDWAALDRLHAESLAASAAYDVIEVPQPVPPDLIDGMLDLQRTMNDAPLDDLALEDHVWDEERYREHEQALSNRHMQNVCLAARVRQTGELAGYTAVVVEEERPHLGFQEDTAVIGAHRGHRLGLRLKIEMLRLLRERHPEIKQIDTWNAVSNTHMIAVNDALGCFVVAEGGVLQRHLVDEPQ